VTGAFLFILPVLAAFCAVAAGVDAAQGNWRSVPLHCIGVGCWVVSWWRLLQWRMKRAVDEGRIREFVRGSR
jgi:hypothetical protein